MISVGVLMGGKSIEREVSFNSGRTICDHLDSTRYRIIPIFQHHNGTLYLLPWHFLHRGKISDFEQRLAPEAESITWDALPELIDFIYIAVHGQYAEDGTLQGFLDILGIPYLGSGLFSSALCMDKIIQKSFLQDAGITTPRDIVVSVDQCTALKKEMPNIIQKLTDAQIPAPWVVKPHAQGSSLGVTIINSTDKLLDAIHVAATADPHKLQPVLIEEKLTGMEFSCIILTQNDGSLLPLPPTEIVPEDGTELFDYQQKYMPGRAHKFTPPRCVPEITTAIQTTCIKAMQALEMKTISRIDGFVTQDNRVVIVDPNTLSGMAPSSFIFREAAEIGMSHTQLINHLIETDIKKYPHLHTMLTAHKTEESSRMNSKKTRIAVLMGGRSHEKEISLESGRNVCYKLNPRIYDVVPIFVSSTFKLHIIDHALLVRNSTAEIELQLSTTQTIGWQDLATIADFVFIGLHGGEGENGSVQGALEMLGLPYNGSSVLASALCMDKYKTNLFAHHNGFETPRNMLITHTQWQHNPSTILTAIGEHCKLPAIIKPHDDGCSTMVNKANTPQECTDALNALFASGKESALVEEYITGTELTIGVIGNTTIQALPPSQSLSSKGILSREEKFLPGAGENQTPAPLSQSTTLFIQEIVANLYKKIGCKGYARIDCFYQSAQESPSKKERVVIIEINTLPALTPATCLFHQAAETGIKPADFIDMIVQFGIEEHQQSMMLPPEQSPTTRQE